MQLFSSYKIKGFSIDNLDQFLIQPTVNSRQYNVSTSRHVIVPLKGMRDKTADSLNGTKSVLLQPICMELHLFEEVHISCMVRSLHSLRQVVTLRHGHMARRFSPAFRTLGVCEHS